jgi:hypothetical protein
MYYNTLHVDAIAAQLCTVRPCHRAADGAPTATVWAVGHECGVDSALARSCVGYDAGPSPQAASILQEVLVRVTVPPQPESTAIEHRDGGAASATPAVPLVAKL